MASRRAVSSFCSTFSRVCSQNIPRQHRISRRTYYAYSAEPFHPIPNKEPKWVTAEEAVSMITSNSKVFVHGCAATPLTLLSALGEYGRRVRLRDVELVHIHTAGDLISSDPENEGIFRSNSFFIGDNARDAVNEGRGDFTPIFLSEIPLLFRRNILNLDAALVQVSPPDEHGFCTLGTNVDCARAAVQNAKVILAEVNPRMPRTFGDGVIHQSHIDAMIAVDRPLPELHRPTPTPEEETIGHLIADNLVEDGATLQMGIGSIPDVVTSKLKDHRDLGVHTEMISDGFVDLVEQGAVTNAKKAYQTGKLVGAFAHGTKRVYDFINDNPFVVLRDVSFVNNTIIIRENPKVTAINSCIEVDLTGQVCADSIGSKLYSGVGGQIDFIRGATLCTDGQGKPIIAMPSTTKDGQSRIVKFIKEGGGVVTTRAHVHYVVTEHGIAYLFGKNLRQRMYELIRIAHPDHREELEKAAYERLKCMPES